jgi:hypothetical protein
MGTAYQKCEGPQGKWTPEPFCWRFEPYVRPDDGHLSVFPGRWVFHTRTLPSPARRRLRKHEGVYRERLPRYMPATT